MAITQVWTSWSKAGLRLILVNIAISEVFDGLWLAGNVECVLIDRKNAEMAVCRFATLLTVLNVVFKLAVLGLGIKELGSVELQQRAKVKFQL